MHDMLGDAPRLLAPVATRATCRIAIRELEHRRGRRVLLSIPALDLTTPGPTVLIGPNGAGKSLLLRLIHELLPVQSGGITVSSPNGTGDVPQAMVFQKPVLLRRSVQGNLSFALRARGVPRKVRRARIPMLLQVGHLKDKARQPARSLSGGEQQRLALLRALATDPALLLLDEPTAPLDPAATLEIERLIHTATAAGTKIVMVTHDLGQARRLADDIVLLHAGRVCEHAPASEFFPEPHTALARAFLAGELLH